MGAAWVGGRPPRGCCGGWVAGRLGRLLLLPLLRLRLGLVLLLLPSACLATVHVVQLSLPALPRPCPRPLPCCSRPGGPVDQVRAHAGAGGGHAALHDPAVGRRPPGGRGAGRGGGGGPAGGGWVASAVAPWSRLDTVLPRPTLLVPGVSQRMDAAKPALHAPPATLPGCRSTSASRTRRARRRACAPWPRLSRRWRRSCRGALLSRAALAWGGQLFGPVPKLLPGTSPALPCQVAGSRCPHAVPTHRPRMPTHRCPCPAA